MNLINELIIERKGSGGQFSSLYAHDMFEYLSFYM